MIKAVLFDKDGTLFELGNLWDEPTQLAYDKLLDRTDFTDSERRSFLCKMGMEAGRMIPNSICAAGSIREQAHEFSKIVDWDENQIAVFLEHEFLTYIKSHPEAFQLVGYMRETLEVLSRDYFLGVVTNDNSALARQALEVTGLKRYFEFVAAADQYPEKPDVASLEALSQQEGFALDEMVYVGDSSIDMQYGKLTAAAIGYASDQSAYDALSEADYIIEDMRQVVEIVNRLNQKEG